MDYVKDDACSACPGSAAQKLQKMQASCPLGWLLFLCARRVDVCRLVLQAVLEDAPTNLDVREALEDQMSSCLLRWQDALDATGRKVLLSGEGGPSPSECSATGRCGNLRRVGHDIAWDATHAREGAPCVV